MDENKEKISPAERISEDITVEIKSENRASANSEREYEFVTETIKKKPVNKRRALKKLIYSIGMGLIAGLVACVIFVVVEPIMYARIHPEELDHVSIPQDEQVEYTENVESQVSDAKGENEAVVSEIEDETSSETDETAGNKDSEENPENGDSEEGDNIESESGKSEDGSLEEGKEENPDNTDEAAGTADEKSDKTEELIKELLNKEVELDDYKLVYRKMSEVANIAKRSLTKVKGVTDGTDWFKNNFESATVSTGIIVADNGKELLIITNSKKLSNAKEIEITFCDNRTYKGTVKKSDPNTDLVVVAVLLEDIDDITKNAYAKAELGNSMLPTLPGTPVLAIGAPLGIEDSMATGIVTSNTKVLEHTDSNIRCITTDIYGSTEGSGVIIDLEGRVLGIIFQGGISVDMKNLVHAYAISDIKSRIEKLSNGQDAAYLGIVGTDVSEYAATELGVPEGAYVKQVVVDSPAMDSGIQNGDVIVKLGTTDIKSFDDYSNAINKSQPGDVAVVTVKRPGKDEYVEFSYEITLEAFK